MITFQRFKKQKKERLKVTFNSSPSNEPSNSSNSYSKSKSKSINFTKLLGTFQATLASFGQLLLEKINFSKLSCYKQHLFKLVRILTRENIFLISIWKPTIPNICITKKPTIENMVSCFLYHSKGHLISFLHPLDFFKISTILD